MKKTEEIIEKIKKEFPCIFLSLDHSIENTIKKFEAEIVLKSECQPIFHSAYAYAVPYKLRDKVEDEIKRLCDMKILEPVRFSKFASPIVIVSKPNKGIRICMDAKLTINPYIKTEHYPLPKTEDIFASLANCKLFCIIDLSGAYQQLKLPEKSREYVTINTHKGLFRYTRLPFDISSAPSIFHSVMDQVLFNIQNVSCYLDDILIGGQDFQNCKKPF